MFVVDWRNIFLIFERYSNENENILDDEMDTNVPANNDYYYEDEYSIEARNRQRELLE